MNNANRYGRLRRSSCHTVSMPKYIIEPVTLFMLALAAVAGAGGGGTVAALHLMRGRRMKFAMTLAYMVVGTTLGLSLFAFGHWMGWDTSTPEKTVGGALLFSMVGTVVLTSKDFMLRWTLERFGWQMRVEFLRSDKKQGD